VVGRNAAVGDDERMLKTAQPTTDLLIICGFRSLVGAMAVGRWHWDVPALRSMPRVIILSKFYYKVYLTKHIYL